MKIDVLNNNLDSNNYLHLINEYGFISLINCITRPNESGRTCLDHVFIKYKSLPNLKMYVAHISLTGHFSIATNISNLVFKRNNPPNPKTINQIDYNKSLVLDNYDWSSIINNSDVNSATNNFIDILQIEINKFSAIKNISSKTKKIKP